MWWYSNQNLNWIMEGVSSLLHGCHSPVDGDISSPVFRVEALRVRFTKDLLPLCVLSPRRWTLKRVRPTWSKWTYGLHLWFCPDATKVCVPFSIVFVSDLLVGWWSILVLQAEVLWLQELKWLCCSLGPTLMLSQVSSRNWLLQIWLHDAV